VHSPSAVAPVSRRDRVLISTCLVVITALAWAYLVHLDRQMSASMEHDTMMAQMGMTKNTSAAMWAVMMVGMMLPSAAPLLLLYGAAARRQDLGATAARQIYALAAGYLTVWALFSVAATVAQQILSARLIVSPMMTTSSTVGAGLLMLAGGWLVTHLSPRDTYGWRSGGITLGRFERGGW